MALDSLIISEIIFIGPARYALMPGVVRKVPTCMYRADMMWP